MTQRERPTVWKMVREAVEALGGRTDNGAVKDWVLKRYPGTNRNTVQCQIIACTVNHPTRIHYSYNVKPGVIDGPHDFLFRESRGQLELYDPQCHGRWEVYERESGGLGVREVRAKTEGADLPATGGVPVGAEAVRETIVDVLENIRAYMHGTVGKGKGRMPDERYASFDYCYNYFRDFHERGAERELAEDEDLQASCLQVGFFLASWGMLRGGAELQNRSVKHFRGLVQVIANAESRVWDIDVGDYGRKEDRRLILGFADRIRGALGTAMTSDTLVTKIMLGVFGNVPALDQNVKKSLGLWKLNEATLLTIHEFYIQHKALLESRPAIFTLDFLSGHETHRRYSMAKLIDMVAFIEGLRG